VWREREGRSELCEAQGGRRWISNPSVLRSQGLYLVAGCRVLADVCWCVRGWRVRCRLVAFAGG
jgi:hypothetical protein